MSGTDQSTDDPLLGVVQDLVNEIAAQRRAITANEKAQLALAGRIDALDERRRKGDGALGQAVQAAAREALGSTAKQMDRWSDDLRRSRDEADNLRRAIARERVAWRPWLYWAAGGGAAAVALLLVLVVKAVGVDRLYAMPYGGDRVEAAAQLFKRASPAYYEQLLAAHKLLQGPAGEGLAACMADAGKKGKPVKCTVTMAPPQVVQKN